MTVLGLAFRLRSRRALGSGRAGKSARELAKRLAIAHSVVVEKHGETITVSTEAGQGTMFTLRLPQAASNLSKQAGHETSPVR